MSHERLGIAAGLGAVTGLRTMTGLAMVSRELAGRRRLSRRASRFEQWLAGGTVSTTLSAIAVGEMVADKLPGVPARVEPAALVGRGLMGGLIGAIAAGRDDRAAGAAAGAAGALAAAFAGWLFRVELRRVTTLPDAAVALAEDALAITAARELVKEL